MPVEAQEFFITSMFVMCLIASPTIVPLFFKTLFGTARGITSFFR